MAPVHWQTLVLKVEKEREDALARVQQLKEANQELTQVGLGFREVVPAATTQPQFTCTCMHVHTRAHIYACMSCTHTHEHTYTLHTQPRIPGVGERPATWGLLPYMALSVCSGGVANSA